MQETKAARKTDIRSLDREQLRTWFTSIAEPRFRADQTYRWLWQKGVKSFAEMTNLSKDLRLKLSKTYEFRPIREDILQHSTDGTIKGRYELYDGNKIEAVLIPVPHQKRFTVCVSCQVGCSLSCTFCATGKMGRIRNLTAGEIYDQVTHINDLCLREFGEKLTNIVYMGMGEPLLNYRNVIQSIRHLTDVDGLHLSAKRITVSTSGIAKMIRRLADEGLKMNLALSLHAPTDKQRSEIMPINLSNDLDSVMEAVGYFYSKTKNRISYEYIAFQKFNDRKEDADNLIKLCQDFPVRVNIIEYNPIQEFNKEKSSPERMDRFAEYLHKRGVTVTVRRSRGKDIDAACGQLANKG